MDFFESLNSFVLENAQIRQVVGDRFYPLILPQNTALPAVIYMPVSANYGAALRVSSGFVRQRVQFSAYDKTYGKARKISRIIKNVFQDYRGDMNGIAVQAVHILSDVIIFGNTQKQFDTEEYVSALEFEFNYTEEK